MRACRLSVRCLRLLRCSSSSCGSSCRQRAPVQQVGPPLPRAAAAPASGASARIAAWLPDNSTVGHRARHRTPPAACSADSRAARRRTNPAAPTRASFSAPGSCRAIASISISAGSSPPDTTKSPIDDLLVDLARDQALVDAFVAARQQHVARAARRRQLHHARDASAACRPATGGSRAVAAHAVRRCAASRRARSPAPAARPASPFPARRRTAGRRPCGARRSRNRADSTRRAATARARARVR